MYMHLDKRPIIFREIRTSYFSIEISIILQEIGLPFNYSSQRIQFGGHL